MIIYQSVNGEDGFGVVEDVAELARVAVDQLQAEGLLEAAIERLLAIDADRVGRLVVDGAVGRSRRLAGRNDVEEAGLALVPHRIARPAGHHAKIQFRLGRVLQDARAPLGGEQGSRQEDRVAAARHQGAPVTFSKKEASNIRPGEREKTWPSA